MNNKVDMKKQFFALGTAALVTAALPVIAADALDEYLDFAVSATRAILGAPAGPAVRIICTDADQEWHLDFAEAGRSTIHREPVDDPVVVMEVAREVSQFLKDAQIPLRRFVRELNQTYSKRTRAGAGRARGRDSKPKR